MIIIFEISSYTAPYVHHFDHHDYNLFVFHSYNNNLLVLRQCQDILSMRFLRLVRADCRELRKRILPKEGGDMQPRTNIALV